MDARLPPKQSSQILDGGGDGDDTMATSTTTPLTGSMTTNMASPLVGRMIPDETLPQCSPTPVMPTSLPTRMTMLDETAEIRDGNEDGGDILDFMQGWAVISRTTTSTSTINGTNADGRLVTTGRLEDVPVDPTRDCEYLLQLQHGATVEVDTFELRPLVEGPVVDVRYPERPPDPLRDPIHDAVTRTLQALEGKQRMGLGGVARGRYTDTAWQHRQLPQPYSGTGTCSSQASSGRLTKHVRSHCGTQTKRGCILIGWAATFDEEVYSMVAQVHGEEQEHMQQRRQEEERVRQHQELVQLGERWQAATRASLTPEANLGVRVAEPPRKRVRVEAMEPAATGASASSRHIFNRVGRLHLDRGFKLLHGPQSYR